MCTNWDMYDTYNPEENKNSNSFISTSRTSVSSAHKENKNNSKTDVFASNF